MQVKIDIKDVREEQEGLDQGIITKAGNINLRRRCKIMLSQNFMTKYNCE